MDHQKRLLQVVCKELGGAEWSLYAQKGWIINTKDGYGLSDLRDWYGVYCNADGKVIRLLLGAVGGLKGQLPSEIGQLSALQCLYMYRNHLNGSIPSELGQLHHLKRLHLENNFLSGDIPPALCQLKQLQELYLNGNQLSGNIPPEIDQMSSLISLELSYNCITGPLPATLGNLRHLQWLGLGHNKLQGAIPASLGDIPTLRYLHLQANFLVGVIPEELGSLANLESMQLFGNQLSGSIPEALGKLSQLRVLTLHDNALSGNVPLQLRRLARLVELDLNGNEGLQDNPGCLSGHAEVGEWLEVTAEGEGLLSVGSPNPTNQALKLTAHGGGGAMEGGREGDDELEEEVVDDDEDDDVNSNGEEVGDVRGGGGGGGGDDAGRDASIDRMLEAQREETVLQGAAAVPPRARLRQPSPRYSNSRGSYAWHHRQGRGDSGAVPPYDSNDSREEGGVGNRKGSAANLVDDVSYAVAVAVLGDKHERNDVGGGDNNGGGGGGGGDDDESGNDSCSVDDNCPSVGYNDYDDLGDGDDDTDDKRGDGVDGEKKRDGTEGKAAVVAAAAGGEAGVGSIARGSGDAASSGEGVMREGEKGAQDTVAVTTAHVPPALAVTVDQPLPLRPPSLVSPPPSSPLSSVVSSPSSILSLTEAVPSPPPPEEEALVSKIGIGVVVVERPRTANDSAKREGGVEGEGKGERKELEGEAAMAVLRTVLSRISFSPSDKDYPADSADAGAKDARRSFKDIAFDVEDGPEGRGRDADMDVMCTAGNAEPLTARTCSSEGGGGGGSGGKKMVCKDGVGVDAGGVVAEGVVLKEDVTPHSSTAASPSNRQQSSSRPSCAVSQVTDLSTPPPSLVKEGGGGGAAGEGDATKARGVKSSAGEVGSQRDGPDELPALPSTTKPKAASCCLIM